MSTTGLAMIVKNEAHIIERCLKSVRALVDHWLIVDTGSTDGTQELVQSLMAGVPGRLYERPFVDFGYNRTELVQAARVAADYTLMMDADEVLEVPAGFSWPDLDVDLMEIRHRRGNLVCRRAKVLTNRISWHYDGVRDEYLHAPRQVTSILMDGASIRVHDDGGRRRGRTFAEVRGADAELLADALRARSADPGLQYHLARALRDSNRPHEALEAFRRRAEMGGNGDEVADSLLEVARLLERTGSDPKTVTAAYLEAWDNHPARAEALVDLARHARNHQRFSIAWMAAQQARRIAQPLEVVWVDQEAYTWRRHDELAVSSYWVGDFEATAAICRELLDAGELPESERARVEENLRYAQAHLASSTMIGSSVADAANPVVAGASDPEPAAPESVETSDSPEPLDDHRPDDEIPDDEDFEEAIRLLPPQAWQAPEVWPSANSVSAEVTTPSVVAVPLLDHMIASLDQHAQLVPAQPPGPTGSTDSTTDSLWSRGPEGAVVNPPRIRLRTERRTEAE